MNLNKVIGLLDLYVDAILEVVHEPSASLVLLVLLEAGGVDMRRHVSELQAEVDAAVFGYLCDFLGKREYTWFAMDSEYGPTLEHHSFKLQDLI